MEDGSISSVRTSPPLAWSAFNGFTSGRIEIVNIECFNGTLFPWLIGEVINRVRLIVHSREYVSNTVGVNSILQWKAGESEILLG